MKVWRVSRDLGLSDMGRMLGVSASSVVKYERNGMNKTQALALAALNEGLSPYKPTEEDIRIYEEKQSGTASDRDK